MTGELRPMELLLLGLKMRGDRGQLADLKGFGHLKAVAVKRGVEGSV